MGKEEITKEIRKFLEINENEDKTYQNFWDAVLKGYYIVIKCQYLKTKVLDEQSNLQP